MAYNVVLRSTFWNAIVPKRGTLAILIIKQLAVFWNDMERLKEGLINSFTVFLLSF
jgi:hypothetical protein